MGIAHRVYAEALLEASQENERLDRVREDFDAFAAAVADSDELREFLANPQIESQTKSAALEDLLAEKSRIAEIADVHEEWERLLAREEQVLELELTTAVELSDEEAARVVEQIEKESGRRVVATRSVDPGLIGGLVVQAGSIRLDASVRGRLQQLREELTATT